MSGGRAKSGEVERALVVALDIGTSSTRALLYDCRGRQQSGSEHQIKYEQTMTADGGVYADPDRLLAATIRALRALLATLDAPMRRRIAGVAVSCFWHSLMGIDDDGHAVTPLYSWADTRSSADAAALAKKWDATGYHARTGCYPHSSYWPAKLMWLSRAEPGLFARATRWISFADYLYLRLFGDADCSISMASSTGLYDPNACEWDAQTIRSLPIAASHLPEIATDNTIRCIPPRNAPLPLTGESARGSAPASDLRALAGVPWFPVYGDGAASNVGAGGTGERSIIVNVGTSGAIRVLAPAERVEIRPKLFAYRADASRFVIGGAMSNGGNLHAWLKSALKLDDGAEHRLEITRRKRPDGHGLTVLPYLAGERSPDWRPDARGVISGLNLHTSSDDVALALTEAMVYPFYEVWKELKSQFPDADSVTVSGGGFQHSRLLAETFADVFGVDVLLCREPESSGRGAAIFAAERLGLGSIGHAPLPRLTPVRYDPSRHAVYRGAMERYRGLYRVLFTSRH